jgi:ketosteroid isomerase-like protein
MRQYTRKPLLTFDKSGRGTWKISIQLYPAGGKKSCPADDA